MCLASMTIVMCRNGSNLDDINDIYEHACRLAQVRDWCRGCSVPNDAENHRTAIGCGFKPIWVGFFRLPLLWFEVSQWRHHGSGCWACSELEGATSKYIFITLSPRITERLTWYWGHVPWEWRRYCYPHLGVSCCLNGNDIPHRTAKFTTTWNPAHIKSGTWSQARWLY